MAFVSVVPKPKEVRQDIIDLANPEEGLLIGDTLYPPSERDNPEQAIAAIEQNKTLGLKYKPLKVRQELLLNYLIDSFIPEDQPEKLVEFVTRLQIVRPDLAVRVLERILPEPEKAPTNQQNIQINQGPAPVILVKSENDKLPNNQLVETEITGELVAPQD